MNVIFTILTAFAFGALIRPRKIAIAIWLAAEAIMFTYQTLWVLLDWLADNPPSAFGPSPTGFPIVYSQSEFGGYGLVNLLIILAGIGLLFLGAWVRSKRDAKRNTVTVSS